MARTLLHNLIKISLASGLFLSLAGLEALGNVSSVSPSVRYMPPPDRGTPPSDRGTGSRGDCLYNAELPPLAALVGEPHLSWTVSDRPTLWAYLPYTMADASYAEVILQTESSDQEIYRGSFLLGTVPGIMGIRLPASMPALEVGESYRWYVDISCTSENSVSAASEPTAKLAPATITGIVKRVAASSELTQALQTASTAREQLTAYGEHHIWYDLLIGLAELRLNSQENEQFDQLWIDLLSDETGADLGDYAEVPLMGIVTAE